MILLEKLDDRFSERGNNRMERNVPIVNLNGPTNPAGDRITHP